MLIAELRRKLPDLDDIDPSQGDALEQLRRLLATRSVPLAAIRSEADVTSLVDAFAADALGDL